MPADSYPEGLTPSRWVNEYTAIAEVDEDTTVEIGDEFIVPTRTVEVDTWRDKLRVWLNKQTTPSNEYHNIHLEKEEVKVQVIDVSEKCCVLEIIATLRYYGSTSLEELLE